MMQFVRIALLVALCVAFAAGSQKRVQLLDEHCPHCQDVISTIETDIASNATDQKIIDALDQVCDLLPPADQAACLAAVAKLGLSLNTSDYFIIYKYSPFALCAMISACHFDCCQTPYTPEQIHISTGSDPTVMTITWTTLENSTSPVAQYGTQQGVFTNTVPAKTHTFSAGGWRGFIHVATLTGLTPATRYYYQVGDPTITYWSDPEWSQPTDMNFVTRPENLSSARIAIFGDMGVTDVSSSTIQQLNQLVETNSIDVIFHIGDIAYSDGWEQLFDQFLRKVETIAAYVPYMTTPGNHEIYYDFETYKSRYPTPYAASGSNTSMYYSFDWGNVHVVAMNTEAPIDTPSYLEPDSEQYKWLENDLKNARANPNTPWVIVGGHRPLYCVPDNGKDCGPFATYLRDCIEKLLLDYKVDMVFSAHMHNIQSTWPVYKTIPVQEDFINPKAPVHVVTGAAGNKEHLTGIGSPPYPSWSRSRYAEYSYGILDAPNATHLTWSFISSENNTVIDQFTIVKNA